MSRRAEWLSILVKCSIHAVTPIRKEAVTALKTVVRLYPGISPFSPQPFHTRTLTHAHIHTRHSLSSLVPYPSFISSLLFLLRTDLRPLLLSTLLRFTVDLPPSRRDEISISLLLAKEIVRLWMFEVQVMAV